jgi:arylsulfatase A-like enzyme
MLAIGIALATACATARQPPPRRPPNLIVILADDLGYGDLGCQGSSQIATPRIDRLAAEGVRMTSFYVPSPLCTPTRAALLTGSYPKRVGLDAGVLRPNATRGLHPDEITIAEVLGRRGYATGAVGKWHLGSLPPFRPTRQGFSEYYGLYHNLDRAETIHFDGAGGMPFMRGEEPVERPASPDVVVERYTDEALRFIRSNRDRPFFLYLAHTMPHLPLGAAPAFRGRSKAGL